MNIRDTVESFYADLWNRGDTSVMAHVLSDTFTFRGSLGTSGTGHECFAAYVTSVRSALADYRCQILDLVTEERRAFARMRFSGRHIGPLLGHTPSGAHVTWLAAALFDAGPDGRIEQLWVLADLQQLHAQLG